jgi:hypothetical protein
MSSDMSSSSDSSPAKSVKSHTKSETPPAAYDPPLYAEVCFNYRSVRAEPVTPSNWFVPTDSEAARLNKQDSNQGSTDSTAQKPAAGVYVQRLIPKKSIPIDAFDENFNEQEWMKRLYGEDVRIIDSVEQIPEGWILVLGIHSTCQGATDG